MARIESLLSARLFLSPQVVGDRLFFVSNMSGRLSLYSMRPGGSVPDPLLPPDIALQNPHLMNGPLFVVLPKSNQILVMMDHDGNERYQPMLIPIDGGYPVPAFGEKLAKLRVHLTEYDRDQQMVYFFAESTEAEEMITFQGNLATGELVEMATSPWGYFVSGAAKDHSRALLLEGYTVGDVVLSQWRKGEPELDLIYGQPLSDRNEGEEVPLTGFGTALYTPDEKAVLVTTSIFEDTYSLGYIRLDAPQQIDRVNILGLKHTGSGELVHLTHLTGNRYTVEYNIDGVSWLYETEFDAESCQMRVRHVLAGEGKLANGYLESCTYDPDGDRFALAFSTATSPTQLYTLEGEQRDRLAQHTQEKVLGISAKHLSPGEDASFISFDGTRISARLYLPAPELVFNGPRPLVYYVHGGPQGQERPDFAWFSMPLIQFLTLNGFAVFVPNVRGSTGYGLNYTKMVDKDWGGNDRLDHVEAMRKLAEDPRVDTSRAGVVGRSYGGYMTLTLAARHPELWKAAVDMFGPFDLFSFMERIPESWKPYMRIAVGDLEKDRELLIDRSPKTHIDNIQAPLLVIQGKNDPRVVEQDSRDLVEYLRGQGKDVEYLMFENEGHDVIKFENRVAAYNRITDFFCRHLQP